MVRGDETIDPARQSERGCDKSVDAPPVGAPLEEALATTAEIQGAAPAARRAITEDASSHRIHEAERASRGVDHDAFDVLEYVLSTAETVAAGLSRLTRYIPLVHDHGTLDLAGEPELGRLVRRVPVVAPQHDEFSMTVLLVRSRRIQDSVEQQPQRRPGGGERSRLV